MAIDFESFFPAIMVQTFISLHVSGFIFLPLSSAFASGSSKKLFWKLFGIRAVALLVGDLFIPEVMMTLDIVVLFVGCFGMIPIMSIVFANRAKSSDKIVVNTSNGLDSKMSVYNDLNKIGFGDPQLLINDLMLYYSNICNDFNERDLYSLKLKCSPGVFGTYQRIIKDGELSDQINKYENCKIVSYKIIEAKKLSNEIYVTIHAELKVLDYAVDSSGKVVRGDNTKKVINFRRLSFSKKLSRKYIDKCPGCGAGLHEKGIGFCSYCGNQVESGNGDWVLRNDTLIDGL